MSHRPSFRNPFSRPPQWGTKDGAGGTVVPSPMDPGPSQCLLQSPSPSPNPPTRQCCEVGVQTEKDPVEPELSTPRHRKGSIARLKHAGKALYIPLALQKMLGRLAAKRALPSTEQSLQRPVPPTPGEGPGPAPSRPPRPNSINSELLNYMGILRFQDVASDSGMPTTSGEVAMAPVAGHRMNDVAFPEVAQGVSDSSIQAGHLQKPQSTSPRLRSCVPPLQEGSIGSSSHTYKVGIAPGPPPTLPLARASFWQVSQRNNIRLPPASVSRWVTGGMLGTGGFGRVYLVYNTVTREQCAMKVVNFRKRIPGPCCRGLINELHVLSLLGSEPRGMPFLLQPYLSDSLWAWRSSAKYLHILTETCTGGDLSAYKKKLNFDSLTLVCAELVLGLNHLHQHGIVHHDLKPHNILVTAKGHCVIADFGGARFVGPAGTLSRDNETMAIMTKAYAAPELLSALQDDEVMAYDERVDYWSLAATLVSLIMHDAFLPGTTDLHFMAYRVQKVKSEMIKMLTPLELQSFVMDLFQMDPCLRPAYSVIRHHPLFEHIDWDDVLNQKGPAIPVVQEVAVDAHGWAYETPKVHRMRDATADFLEELRKDHLSLVEDDSYDVSKHHANIVRPL